MYDRILVPTDGGDAATVALDHAIEVAIDHDATVHAFYAADTNRDSVTRVGGETVDALETAGEEIVAEARDRARERGASADSEVRQGSPAESIVGYADAIETDLIVMGTHGRRGFQRFVLGSVAENVVRRSPVPVVTIRADDSVAPTYPYDSILVPIDDSEFSAVARDVAVETARRTGATLHLLSVVDASTVRADGWEYGVAERLVDTAGDIVESAAELARDEGVERVVTEVEVGSIAREIRSYAEETEPALVVVGTHGRSGFDRYLLGSVAERVIRTAPAPVMAVRPDDRDGDEA